MISSNYRRWTWITTVVRPSNNYWIIQLHRPYVREPPLVDTLFYWSYWRTQPEIHGNMCSVRNPNRMAPANIKCKHPFLMPGEHFIYCQTFILRCEMRLYFTQWMCIARKFVSGLMLLIIFLSVHLLFTPGGDTLDPKLFWVEFASCFLDIAQLCEL